MADPREQTVQLLNEAKLADDPAAKKERLQQLLELLLYHHSDFVPEFVPHIAELHLEPVAATRRLAAHMMEKLGMKYPEQAAIMLPALETLLSDESPAVAKHALMAGAGLLRALLDALLLQGVEHKAADSRLEQGWAAMTSFRNASWKAAEQPGNDSVRLHALKLLETTVLLFTPDPTIPKVGSNAAANGTGTSSPIRVSVAWLASNSHSVLDAAELSQEALRSVSRLVSLLRPPAAAAVSAPVAIVLLNSVASVARQRPALFGRLLPALLALPPDLAALQQARSASVEHALKTALLALLKCTHANAVPWRERMGDALRALGADAAVDSAIRQLGRDSQHSSTPAWVATPKQEDSEEETAIARPAIGNSKRLSSNQPSAAATPKRARVDASGVLATSDPAPGPGPGPGVGAGVGEPVGLQNPQQSPLEQMMGMLGALVARGPKAAAAVEELVNSLPAQVLADVVIAYMHHLPQSPPQGELPVTPAPPPEEPGLARSVSSARDPRASRRVPKEEPAAAPPAVPPAAAPAVPPAAPAHPSALPHAAALATSPAPHVAPAHPSAAPPAASPAVPAALKQHPAEGLATSLQKSEPVESSSAGWALVESAPAPPMEVEIARPSGGSSIVVTELTPAERKALRVAALGRILNSKLGPASLPPPVGGALIARLAAQADDKGAGLDSLRAHVLSDYSSLHGHEIATAVLFQLYRAPSAEYEAFLLALVEELAERQPPGDKSLQRLLCEAPLLPPTAFPLLQRLCHRKSVPGGGDAATQGLSTVWAILLARPPVRHPCLNVALQCATSEVESVRSKAIRLVANKLHSMPALAGVIEDAARQELYGAVRGQSGVGTDAHAQADMKPEGTLLDKAPAAEEEDAPGGRRSDAGPTPSSPGPQAVAQRRIALFLALCSKRHELLLELFEAYGQATAPTQEAISVEVAMLMRAVGATSAALVTLVQKLPQGSKPLLLKALQCLADTSPLPAPLVEAVKQRQGGGAQGGELLLPLLPALGREEVVAALPALVSLPLPSFKTALARILQGTAESGPALAPPDLLIALHALDAQRHHVPIKKVMDAVAACLQQRSVFSQPVLAQALNQLVEQTPLPLLFMRTVLQAVRLFPALKSFVADLLSRLITKQVWRALPQIWEGFLKCAVQLAPLSFPALLQLPAAQLEVALTQQTGLRQQLAQHIADPAVRTSIPRASLQLFEPAAAAPIPEIHPPEPPASAPVS